MEGYIGSRAKKRRRNFFLLLSFLLVFLLIILFFPKIDFNENTPAPDDAIFPKPNEEISSLSSKVEDLNLTIFQKDQKIKFRDGQINKLKKEINDLKINYENGQSDYNRLQGEYTNFVESNSEKKNLEVDNNQINDFTSQIKNLKKLNEKNKIMISESQKKLSILEKENKNNTSNTINISNEKEALKKEYKIIVSKNMKLSDSVKNSESIIKSLESIIKSQKDDIKNKKDEIENLKDKNSHHYR